MTQCIFAINSLTYAMKGQQVLHERAIWSQVVKIDSELTKKGCAYGIQIECKNLNNVKNILMKYNIPFSEILGG